MREYPLDAIIIKGIDYGEGHRILTLFSKEEGKISAMARGVRKPKAKLAGHLQLLNRCQCILTRGKGLDTITQATANFTYPHIRENPKAYLYSSYFMELMNASLQEKEVEEEIFFLLHQTLLALEKIEPQKVARYFEIHLLSLLGYGVDFKTCVGCGKPLKEGFLSPRFEGIVCENCGSGYPVTPKTIYALEYFKNTPYERIDRLKLDEETAKAMARLTTHMLRFHLDKKIKSWDIIDHI